MNDAVDSNEACVAAHSCAASEREPTQRNAIAVAVCAGQSFQLCDTYSQILPHLFSREFVIGITAFFIPTTSMSLSPAGALEPCADALAARAELLTLEDALDESET